MGLVCALLVVMAYTVSYAFRKRGFWWGVLTLADFILLLVICHLT